MTRFIVASIACGLMTPLVAHAEEAWLEALTPTLPVVTASTSGALSGGAAALLPGKDPSGECLRTSAIGGHCLTVSQRFGLIGAGSTNAFEPSVSVSMVAPSGFAIRAAVARLQFASPDTDNSRNVATLRVGSAGRNAGFDVGVYVIETVVLPAFSLRLGPARPAWLFLGLLDDTNLLEALRVGIGLRTPDGIVVRLGMTTAVFVAGPFADVEIPVNASVSVGLHVAGGGPTGPLGGHWGMGRIGLSMRL